ncbi:MAG: inositol monophosphatase [Deltaproteobacteria bacterium]|nr:inositol monophosphatase [Deltaproteobacteria bacterium]
MNSALDVARRAAQKGGDCIRKSWGRVHDVQFKGAVDLVTETDLESQRIIVAEIRGAFPDHSILAEEEGLSEERGDDLWMIDPLDGTTNFAHRFPFVCVSIAHLKEDVIDIGVIYNPMLNEFFWAERGCGAYLNNRRIRVSEASDLRKSLIATGFPYDLESVRSEVIRRFENMLSSSQGIRRAGSAALDLAYVASGALDGFWEQLLKPWDIAAGILLVEEAGGRVSDFHGNPVDLLGGRTMASNGRIHAQMSEKLSLEREKEKDVAASYGR